MLPNNVKLFKNKIMIIKLIIKKLRECLYEILSRARLNIFISVSGQFLRTAYMMQPEMKLISLRLGGVYMRPKRNLPKTKFQSTIKKIMFTLLFISGEMKRISFWSGPRQTAH